MFTQSASRTSRSKYFNCFLISEAITELKWERFTCPMSFPQCHYDWSVTGDNNIMVNIPVVINDLIHFNVFFLFFRMTNSPVL
jgi:hypothetical protein